MVVDDDLQFLTILSRNMVARGYLVMAAASGADLFAKLPGFKPDAFILDVMMPGMDGAQVAEQLGRNAMAARKPIIFISALFSPHDPEDSPSNPNHHYLCKPLEIEALMRLFRRIGL